MEAAGGRVVCGGGRLVVWLANQREKSKGGLRARERETERGVENRGMEGDGGWGSRAVAR